MQWSFSFLPPRLQYDHRRDQPLRHCASSANQPAGRGPAVSYAGREIPWPPPATGAPLRASFASRGRHVRDLPCGSSAGRRAPPGASADERWPQASPSRRDKLRQLRQAPFVRRLAGLGSGHPFPVGPMWHPRFLFNPSSQSKLAVVKSRSTRVLTSKTSPATLMTLLIKLTHMCGQALVKSTVKPYLNPSDLECLPELVAFSNFHLNTSKSTNTKVFQFVEGHNFHVRWHFQFWVEKGRNFGQLTAPPVHWRRMAFKPWVPFMQNLLRKTLCGLCESCRG
jgi:hypothetical protein